MDVLLLCHSSKGVTLGDGFRMVADDIAGGHLHRLADAPMIDLPAYAVYPVCIARTELVKEVPALFEYKVDLNEL